MEKQNAEFIKKKRNKNKKAASFYQGNFQKNQFTV